jgi:hypothetical protein
MLRTNLLVAAAFLTVSGLLSAGTITGVCGTGFSSGCTTLGGAGTVDAYWALTSAPEATTGTDAFVTDGSPGTFPFPIWVANTASAQWISPEANENTADSVGVYVYTETFSLSGYNLATVDLTGMFAADNSGEIWLNGVDTGIGKTGLSSFSSVFNITSGFVSGLNTIQFEVTNTSATGADPTGLIVELSGTGTLSTVPEPASFAFIGLGLGALGLLGRRLRRS